MTTFTSRVELGKAYKDERSGIEGAASAVCFQEHGCVEIVLEYMSSGKPETMVVNELRLVTPNGGAPLTESHSYETDLVLGHKYEDIQTKLKGHLAVIEFHEFMATRGILRRPTGGKQNTTIKYISIDDFLLKDLETKVVAEDRSGKKSPVTRELGETYR